VSAGTAAATPTGFVATTGPAERPDGIAATGKAAGGGAGIAVGGAGGSQEMKPQTDADKEKV